MSGKKLNRRDALRAIGLAAAGVTAAACQPQTVIVEKEVEKLVTQVVEVEKEVTKIVAGTPIVEKIVETKIVEKEVTVAPTIAPEVHIWPMIAFIRPEGSHPEKYEAVQEYIQAQTGIKPVGYAPPPGAAGREKLNLQLGSKDLRLDVFTGNWPTYKDIIIPINDLLEQYGQNILAAHREINMSGMKDAEGNIWGVPRLGLMGHTAFTWFRSDWLEEIGMDMPQTLEEMEAAMTAFKERNPDAVMITNALGSMRMCLVGGWTENGYARWFDESDGKIKPPELQPGFKDWLAKMNEWWEKDWFHKETLSQMDFEEVVKTGNAGIHVGWYSRITILVQRLIQENAVPGMQWDFPLVLTGPKGDMRTNNASMTSAKMVTKKCPNPEAVIRLMNWEYDPGKDNVCTAVYGIPSVDWEWADPSDKYYVRRLAKDIENQPVYAGEFMCATGLGTDHWYAPDDDVWRRHYEHIRDYVFVYDNAKMPDDFDVPYDESIINDKVPGMEDINRLIAEETTKFITGVRPVSEYEDWIDTLYKAGLDDWIEAYTEQYLLKHP